MKTRIVFSFRYRVECCMSSGALSGLTPQPFLERRAGEDRLRAWQQGTRLVELAVRVSRVARDLDSHRVATPGGEQSRGLEKALLARTGDLEHRPAACANSARSSPHPAGPTPRARGRTRGTARPSGCVPGSARPASHAPARASPRSSRR